MLGKMQSSKTNIFTLLSIAIVFLSAALSNLPVTEVLFNRWLKFDENLGHALPLLAFSYYFLFQASKTLEFRRGISITSLVLFSALFSIAFVANKYNILIVQQLSVWCGIFTAYYFLFKAESVKNSLFPLAMLIFIIPVWDQLVPTLAQITAVVVEFFLQFSGIVAYINGRHIELPSGIITVADACSGVRYVTIGLALSYITAFTLDISLKKRVLLILFGLFLSIIANWIRVFIIVLIGYKTEMQSELVNDHETFGFILFFILISPILFYKARENVVDDKFSKYLLIKLDLIFSAETCKVHNIAKLFILLLLSGGFGLLLTI